MSVIDQVRDVNATHLLRLNKIYPLPSFVKDAEAMSGADISKIALSTFADRSNRMFPCDSKSNTYLSYMYFLDSEGEMPTKQARTIRDNLDRMANFWNLHGPNGPVTVLKEAHARHTADAFAAMTDDDFAIVEKYASEVVRRLPMPNGPSVKKASEALLRDRRRYPYAWRKKAALKILKKARELEVELESDTMDYLHKAAGYGANDAKSISNALHERAHVLREFSRFRSAADQLSKFAEEIRTVTVTEAVREKIAAYIDVVDRKTGLFKKYAATNGIPIDHPLPTPEEVVYAVTEKQASAYLDQFITLTSGHVFNKDDLEKAGVDVFTAALGDDVEPFLFDPDTQRLNIEKASEILPTLPSPDAYGLAAALGLAGIAAVKKDAQAALGLNKEARLRATAYHQFNDLQGWKDYMRECSAKFAGSGVKPKLMVGGEEWEEAQELRNNPPRAHAYVI